jgi:hypothetical protein
VVAGHPGEGFGAQGQAGARVEKGFEEVGDTGGGGEELFRRGETALGQAGAGCGEEFPT